MKEFHPELLPGRHPSSDSRSSHPEQDVPDDRDRCGEEHKNPPFAASAIRVGVTGFSLSDQARSSDQQSQPSRKPGIRIFLPHLQSLDLHLLNHLNLLQAQGLLEVL